MESKWDKTRSRFSVKTFDLFNVPAFRVLFASMSGMWLAFGMIVIVETLLIYRLTGSAFLIGAGFSGFGVLFTGALSDAVGLQLAVGGMGGQFPIN